MRVLNFSWFSEGGIVVKRLCILSCFVLVAAFAPAQQQPTKEFIFSGASFEGTCQKLPQPSFTIGPSGNRGATKDRLTVKCVSSLLSFTFTIDASVPSAFDQNIYTFRWGESKTPGHAGLGGQFTRNEKLCKELADLFYSTLSTVPTSSSEPALAAMHWSATCNGDDLWGMSMEIEASPHAEVRNPRSLHER